MTSEERAVWIGERLFNRVFKRVKIEGLQSLVDDREYRYVTPATREEMRGFRCGSDDLLDLETFTEWLSSPDGLHAVKASMIEKGYFPNIIYSEDKKWLCVFYKRFISWRGLADTEAEAVLFATELTLKWIEENPELALKMESGS